MKMPDIDAATLQAALEGRLGAIDALLQAIQPGVFNLAVRMLGNREDAGDATQEILLRVVTHLAAFRRESAFGTWVFSIARNHLLTALTRSRESPLLSLDAMAERLEAGLEFGASIAQSRSGDVALTPEDKLAARQTAIDCTQKMLMALDRDQRLAYVLDAVFGLSSHEGAQVLGIAAAAYRKRLSRARQALDPFVRGTCGLVNPEAACRCERQLPALRHERTVQPGAAARPLADGDEAADADRQFDALMRMSDAAALFRAHPAYRVPDSMTAVIRSVLRAEGWWGHDDARPH